MSAGAGGMGGAAGGMGGMGGMGGGGAGGMDISSMMGGGGGGGMGGMMGGGGSDGGGSAAPYPSVLVPAAPVAYANPQLDSPQPNVPQKGSVRSLMEMLQNGQGGMPTPGGAPMPQGGEDMKARLTTLTDMFKTLSQDTDFLDAIARFQGMGSSGGNMAGGGSFGGLGSGATGTLAGGG